jgi:type II secretion system protein N
VRFGRVLVALAVGVTVFTVTLAFVFPTDAVVRAALARFVRPDQPTITFTRARLRPWGLQLDDPALRRPDGSAIVTAEWATVRPSLWGLLADRTGRPWRVRAATCGGEITARLERDQADTALALAWDTIALADCPSLPQFDFTVTGVAEGTARLRRTPTGPSGEGHLVLRAAAVRAPGRGLPGLDTLRADPGSTHWTLAAGRLVFDPIEVRGPDVSANGRGSVHLAPVTADSAIDFRLEVTPGTKPNPLLVRIIGTLPPADGGARLLVLGGTFAVPQLMR